jgi:hypothetical protein
VNASLLVLPDAARLGDIDSECVDRPPGDLIFLEVQVIKGGLGGEMAYKPCVRVCFHLVTDEPRSPPIGESNH